MAKKFPDKLGPCIDLAKTLRDARLKLQKEVETAKKHEELLRTHIFGRFKFQEVDGASGEIATASLSKETIGQIQDKEKLTRWIRKTGSFELISFHVNNKAFRERLEAKKTIPGVAPFVVTKLSLTKRKGRRK